MCAVVVRSIKYCLKKKNKNVSLNTYRANLNLNEVWKIKEKNSFYIKKKLRSFIYIILYIILYIIYVIYIIYT